VYAEDRKHWHKVAREWRGVSEERHGRTPDLQDAGTGQLLFRPSIVNDSVTKSKFDNLYGCREPLADGIQAGHGRDGTGKVAVICGYGDVARARRLAEGDGRAGDRDGG